MSAVFISVPHFFPRHLLVTFISKEENNHVRDWYHWCPHHKNDVKVKGKDNGSESVLNYRFVCTHRHRCLKDVSREIIAATRVRSQKRHQLGQLGAPARQAAEDFSFWFRNWISLVLLRFPRQ